MFPPCCVFLSLCTTLEAERKDTESVTDSSLADDCWMKGRNASERLRGVCMVCGLQHKATHERTPATTINIRHRWPIKRKNKSWTLRKQALWSAEGSDAGSARRFQRNLIGSCHSPRPKIGRNGILFFCAGKCEEKDSSLSASVKSRLTHFHVLSLQICFITERAQWAKRQKSERMD